ncbi:phosphotransferase [Nevskia sp.]|uniref:phosphotransferase family protein n=1 Tax=Nevskia sp. TaxID=1929292 RepID=UPI0025D13E16|nr:phosphotransferase [Nevskia sp.]
MNTPTAPLRHDPAAGHPLIPGPEGLTPVWLTTVLRAVGKLRTATVTSATTTPVGNGMLGTNLRIKLGYDQPEAGAPASLVAKLQAAGETSRASGAALGLYERETRFYQVIAPRIGGPVPTTYFADVSADGATFCLLFEDLAPARGGDQLTGCSVADAEAAMDTAAAIHASVWGDAETLAQPWMARAQMVGMYTAQLPPCVAAIKPRFAALLEPGVPAILDAFAAVIGPWFAQQTAPFTIAHHDYRLDNILFDARGGATPVAALDWQTLMAGPGVLDVAYFIGAGLLADDRRANEERLARRYHAALLARGIRDYDWDRCWHDYRLTAAHGLIMAVVGAAITTPTERGDRMLSTMINRHARQMVDLDTLSLIR